MGEQRRPNQDLYIDSTVQSAFREAGKGNFLTQKELAMLGQIHRSYDATKIFEEITGRKIDSSSALVELFTSASKGEINLSEILQSPKLATYTERTSPFALD